MGFRGGSQFLGVPSDASTCPWCAQSLIPSGVMEVTSSFAGTDQLRRKSSNPGAGRPQWLKIPAQRVPLPGRKRLDDVQTGHSRDHLIETEPSFTQKVAIFLDGALLPSGHEHHDYIRDLSSGGSISFG
jgi:hypothetical protein